MGDKAWKPHGPRGTEYHKRDCGDAARSLYSLESGLSCAFVGGSRDNPGGRERADLCAASDEEEMAKRTQAPADLTADEKRSVWAWAQKHHPWLTREQARLGVADCLEYHAARGTTWARWDLVCIRWIRENIKSGKIREPTPLDSVAAERERQALAERRRYMRAAKQELERLGPLEIQALVEQSRGQRGF